LIHFYKRSIEVIQMGKCAKICTIVSGVLGVVFIILGVCLKYAILPVVVDSLVMSKLELVESNTETWDAFVTPPVTPFMKFTFFEVQNPEDVINGIKPKVTEIGPFSYIENREKDNILSIQEKISYGSYIDYVFDDETSCPECTIDKNVTVINPLPIMIDYLVNKLLHDIEMMTIGGIPIGSIPIGNGVTIPQLAEIIANNITDTLNLWTSECEDETSQFYDFCEDIVITGTPDDMIFQGIESGTLKATYYFLTSEEPGALPDQLIYGLAEGIPVLCQDMLNGEYGWLYNIIKDIEIDIGLGTMTGKAIVELLATPAGKLLLKNILNSAIPPLVKGLVDGLPLPPMLNLQEGTFGFFKGTNATRTWWKINNGKYNMDEYQQVLEFNGNSRLPDNWWEDFGPTPSATASGQKGVCHDIIGTDGLAFSPGVSKTDTLWLFNDQLCRSIWLTYERDHDISGIKTLRFVPPNEVFNFSNPNNYCYCPGVNECSKVIEGEDKYDLSGCTMCRDGIISLEGCQGVPVIMSTPHFLDGDPQLVENIDGIDPVRELHQTYLHLEPLSGAPMQAHKRIQISLPLLQSQRFDMLNNVKESVFPLAWVDEGADIDDENLKLAKSFLVTPFIAVDATMGVLIALGCMLIMGAIVQGCRSRRQNC